MAMDGTKLIKLVNTMEIRGGRLEKLRESIALAVTPHLAGFGRIPECVAARE